MSTTLQEKSSYIKANIAEMKKLINEFNINTIAKKRGELYVLWRSGLNLFSGLSIFIVLYYFAFDQFLKGNYLLGIVCCLGMGVINLKLFNVQHDCGHKSFLMNNKKIYRTTMNVIGCGVMMCTGFPYHSWFPRHFYHHANACKHDFAFGDIHYDQVKDYLEKSVHERAYYRIVKGLFTLIFIYPLYYKYYTLQIHQPSEKVVFERGYAKFRKNKIFSVLLLNGFTALVFSLLWIFGGIKLACIYLAINFISKYSFGSLAFIFFYGQHTFEGVYREGNKVIDKTLANWLGSSVMILDPISNWISSRINKHFIHHENSLAPNWALDKAYKKLMSSFPELRKIVPHITVKDVFKAIRHCKLWYKNDDPSKGKIYNGYISFKEAEKLDLIPKEGNPLMLLLFGKKVAT